MSINKWIVVAAMASLLPCAVSRAATEANFTLGSTGDLVALCSAAPAKRHRDCGAQLLRGLFAGCRDRRDAEHVRISRAKAVLFAQPAAGTIGGDERICQLGAGRTRSHDPIADRRRIWVLARPLSMRGGIALNGLNPEESL